MPDDPKPTPETPDLGKLVEAAVAKYGDLTSATKALVSDVVALREDNKALKAKIPADGTIVLSGDDAKEWGAYRGLGKPSELRNAVAERDTLTTEVAGFRRDTELRSVAETAGVKFPVLRTLAGPTLAFEVKPVKARDKAGKEVETPTVFVKDGEAAAVPFDEYAQKNWGDFLPALKPAAPTQQQQATRPNPTPNRLDPTRPLTQSNGNGLAPPNRPAPLDPGARLLADARRSF